MGIHFTELIIIAAIALIVMGPDKFPDFAKIFLRTIRDLRGYMDEVKEEVSKEIRPIEREMRNLSKYSPEKYIDSMIDSGKNSDKPNKSELKSSDKSKTSDTVKSTPGTPSDDTAFTSPGSGSVESSSSQSYPYGDLQPGEQRTTNETVPEGSEYVGNEEVSSDVESKGADNPVHDVQKQDQSHKETSAATSMDTSAETDKQKSYPPPEPLD